ncbi:GHKL domain-containing protein [Psychrobacillus glaciei]|uniref:GHKL domain-containing protein n=1 Tax=Psychrobacillus glaciei TaxID=2283160 RepID=A0A5J6STC6_9BACI|nr:GHKL domain-containing protein [Psychrobacillus glaciei]
MGFYLFKKVPLNLSSLKTKWNTVLFIVQLLLVFLNISTDSLLANITILLAYISIEVVRIVWANQIASFSKKLTYFEEQSMHFNDTFRLVRNERHDFLKHVSTIHFLLEKGEHNKAKSYLDELVGGYEETNLSIKGERGIVAGVLHQIYKKAKASGISVVYDFDIPLSALPLSDRHMVTLLGNLLSNSIDACEAWQQKTNESSLITVQFFKRSGLYIFICKNNTLPIPTNILDNLFHSYGNTTKSGDHEGLGTKMIQEIVQQHQGFLDFIFKNEEFSVKIKIPAMR